MIGLVATGSIGNVFGALVDFLHVFAISASLHLLALALVVHIARHDVYVMWVYVQSIWWSLDD